MEPKIATLVRENPNPFAVEASRQSQGSMLDVASSRSAQEVQAAMVIAKRFPRNEEQAYAKIMAACRRPKLAESARYVYKKGGSKIEGPSIRLAEELARSWGNIDFGLIELDQKDGESTIMAYAWDLETNSRQTKVFQVKHEYKANGEIKRLTDPRDIYEYTANQGARRLRSAILAIIPGDVTEAALEECTKTLAGQTKAPISDRVRKMVVAFSEIGVNVAMLEKHLGHKMDATDEQELVNLRKVYTSIRDGFSNRDDWFELVEEAQKSDLATKEKVKSKPAKEQEPAKSAPEPEKPVAENDPRVGQEEAQSPEVPLTTLYKLMKRDKVFEAELMAALIARGVAKEGQELPELADSKIGAIVESWETWEAQVRANRSKLINQ